MDEDDGSDNEVISVNFQKLDPTCSTIFSVLNWFKNYCLKHIPYASIRMYEAEGGTIAKFATANDSSFAGSVSMVMSKLFKVGNDWSFKVYGQSVPERGPADAREAVRTRYL